MAGLLQHCRAGKITAIASGTAGGQRNHAKSALHAQRQEVTDSVMLGYLYEGQICSAAHA
jgi:hypothetical protein